MAYSNLIISDTEDTIRKKRTWIRIFYILVLIQALIVDSTFSDQSDQFFVWHLAFLHSLENIPTFITSCVRIGPETVAVYVCRSPVKSPVHHQQPKPTYLHLRQRLLAISGNLVYVFVHLLLCGKDFYNNAIGWRDPLYTNMWIPVAKFQRVALVTYGTLR